MDRLDQTRGSDSTRNRTVFRSIREIFTVNQVRAAFIEQRGDTFAFGRVPVGDDVIEIDRSEAKNLYSLIKEEEKDSEDREFERDSSTE